MPVTSGVRLRRRAGPCAAVGERDADARARAPLRGKSRPQAAPHSLPGTVTAVNSWLGTVTSARHLAFSGPSVPELLREISSEHLT